MTSVTSLLFFDMTVTANHSLWYVFVKNPYIVTSVMSLLFFDMTVTANNNLCYVFVNNPYIVTSVTSLLFFDMTVTANNSLWYAFVYNPYSYEGCFPSKICLWFGNKNSFYLKLVPVICTVFQFCIIE